MPLPDPAPRQPLHTRTITARGFERDDGLWDIEGWLTDTKAYGFHNAWRGEMQPGDPVHGMGLRLTLDARYTLVDVVAATDHSPFQICPAITPNFRRLIGLAIGPGWMTEVKRRVGGIAGCTHLVELLPVLATTAIQTMGPSLSRRRAQNAAAAAAAGAGGAAAAAAGAGGAHPQRARPRVLNTCHAWDEAGEAVRQHYPEWHRPRAAD